MKVLITGASGFIGSALMNELSGSVQFELFGIKGSQEGKFKPNVTFVQADLSKDDFTSNLPEQIDVVVHLAQSKHYREFPQKANDIFNVNVRSTQLLLDWSARSGVKKFIYASSGNVYKPMAEPLKENDLCEPITYYGSSKLAAENLIHSYSGSFQVIILRLFGVYGPGQTNMTIPNIINRVKNKEEITLAGGVGLYFTPLYITDCVNALIELIKRQTPLKHVVYNVGGNEKIELEQLVKEISELLNIKPVIRITKNEPMFLMADTTRLCKEIGSIFQTNIINGIKKTIEHE